MAVSGRKTNSFETSINKGSAEDYDHTCDPCCTDGQCVEAHGYCVECQDYLCIACFRSHSKSRASKHHQLLDNSASVPRNALQPPPDTCTEKCPKHGREIIKFFCAEHKALGCNDCIILDHRTCKIDYIPDKSVGFASSNEQIGALKDLDDLFGKVSNVQKMADKKTIEVDQVHKKIEEDINTFQKEINDRIAELKKQVMDEADRLRETKKNEMGRVLKTCEKVTTNIKRVQHDANSSIAEKRDGQAFISVKRAEQLMKSDDMKEAESAVGEIRTYNTFQRNKVIENLFHDNSVMGKLISGREPDAVCRNVRDAVISRSKAGKALVSVALDIGSTHSGYGFSFRHDYERDCYKVSICNWLHGSLFTKKAPTAILLKPDRSPCAFGFEAIEKYNELVMDERSKDYYFFEAFTMDLYRLTDAKQTDAMIEDVVGRKLDGCYVLASLIKYMKDHALETLGKRMPRMREENVHWVVTVPERFVTATQAYEKAAKMAGIVSSNLAVVFESEAAFSYIQALSVGQFVGECNQVSVAQFREGAKYLVLDAGGNMVTSTIYEVGNKKSRQLLHAFDSFGGRNVDDEFQKFMSSIFGNDVIQKLKEEYIEDFEDMITSFELRKRSFASKGNAKVTFKIPRALSDIYKEFTGKSTKEAVSPQPFQGKITVFGDKLRVDAELFENLFKPTVDAIVAHLSFVLQDESALGYDTVVMVGGFSESPILQDGVRKAFPRVKVMVPEEPEVAVIKGAVILGHSSIKCAILPFLPVF